MRAHAAFGGIAHESMDQSYSPIEWRTTSRQQHPSQPTPLSSPFFFPTSLLTPVFLPQPISLLRRYPSTPFQSPCRAPSKYPAVGGRLRTSSVTKLPVVPRTPRALRFRLLRLHLALGLRTIVRVGRCLRMRERLACLLLLGRPGG